MKNLIYCFLAACVSALVLVGCEKKEEPAVPTPPDAPKEAPAVPK